MAVFLDESYHGRKALSARGIRTMNMEDAPAGMVNLGVVNLMPQADQYELELISAFSGVSTPMRFTWIRVHNHGYSSSNPQVIAGYRFFGDVVDRLDGLVITGAPVEKLPFDQVHYWPELQDILTEARAKITTTLGICWGGLAMGRMLGLEKEVFENKLFGVFPTENLEPRHQLAGSFGENFSCPVSTYAAISDQSWKSAEEAGLVRLLARSREAGYLIAESIDHRFLIHVGHPEYSPFRLPEEYARDCRKGRINVAPPQNVNLDKPTCDWAEQSGRFFENWIKFLATRPISPFL